MYIYVYKVNDYIGIMREYRYTYRYVCIGIRGYMGI